MRALSKFFATSKDASSDTKDKRQNSNYKEQHDTSPTVPWLKYHALVLPPEQADLLSPDGTQIIQSVPLPIHTGNEQRIDRDALHSVLVHTGFPENFQVDPGNLYRPMEATTRMCAGPVEKKLVDGAPSETNMTQAFSGHSSVPPNYNSIWKTSDLTTYSVNQVDYSKVGQKNIQSLSCARVSSLPPHLLGKPPPIYLKPVLQTNENGLTKAPKSVESLSTNEMVSTSYENLRKTSADLSMVDPTLGGPKLYAYRPGDYVWSSEDIKKLTQDPSVVYNSEKKMAPLPYNPVSSHIPWVNGTTKNVTDPTTFELHGGGYLMAHEEFTESNQSKKPYFYGLNKDEKQLVSNYELFGFPKIASLSNKLKSEIVASAPRKAEIRTDPELGGLGMFASQEISAGEIVFVDKPFLLCTTQFDSMWEAFNKLTDKDFEAIKTVQTHESACTYNEMNECLTRCVNAGCPGKYESFKRFVNIMKCNGHGLSDAPDKWALFLEGIRANHSCNPNVSYRNVNGLLCYVATKKIEAGTAITMTYTDELYSSTVYRQKKLLRDKCFKCTCRRCTNIKDVCRQILCLKCRPNKNKEDATQIAKTEGNNNEVERIVPQTLGGGSAKLTKATAKLVPIEEINESWSSSRQQSDYAASGEDEVDSVICSSEGEAEQQSNKTNKVELSADTVPNKSNKQTLEEHNKKENNAAENALKIKTKVDSVGVTVDTSEEETALTNSGGDQASSDMQAETSEEESSDAEKSRKTDITQFSQKDMRNSLDPSVPRGYCQLEAPNLWLCHTCGSTFTDDLFPLDSEKHLMQQWEQLNLLFDQPDCGELQKQCEKMLACVETVFGTEHWLYAGARYLLSKVSLGLYQGGVVLEDSFDAGLSHANFFLEYIKKKTPAAMYIDGVPWASTIMRLVLFNGRWEIFQDFVRKGYLDDMRVCYGYWDETYLSYKEAYDYICSTQAPRLSMLHHYAHSSQRIAAEMTHKEQIKIEKEEETKKAAEIAFKTKQQEELKIKAAAVANKKVVNIQQNLCAEHSGLNSMAQTSIKMPRDVNFLHPDSILNKFMFGGLKHPPGIFQSALQVAHNKYVEETKKKLQEKWSQKNKQTLVNKQLSQKAVPDGEYNLPLLQSRHSLDDWYKNERETPPLFYRIPGLSGAAPGEYVSISQMNHSPDNKFPELPFFTNFFHVNNDAKKCQKDGDTMTVKSSYNVVPGMEALKKAQDTYSRNEKDYTKKEIKIALENQNIGKHSHEHQIIKVNQKRTDCINGRREKTALDISEGLASNEIPIFVSSENEINYCLGSRNNMQKAPVLPFKISKDFSIAYPKEILNGLTVAHGQCKLKNYAADEDISCNKSSCSASTEDFQLSSGGNQSVLQSVASQRTQQLKALPHERTLPHPQSYLDHRNFAQHGAYKNTLIDQQMMQRQYQLHKTGLHYNLATTVAGGVMLGNFPPNMATMANTHLPVQSSQQKLRRSRTLSRGRNSGKGKNSKFGRKHFFEICG